MSKWPVLLFALACTGAPSLSGCTPSANVQNGKAPGAPFATYQTFSFGESEGAPERYTSSPRSVELRRRMRPLVVTEFEKKGYVLVDGKKGDVVIELASGQRIGKTHAPRPSHTVGNDAEEDEPFVEGSFVVNVFDGSDGGQVWHGSSHGEIDPDKIDDKRLQGAVTKVLAKFPASRGVVIRSATPSASSAP